MSMSEGARTSEPIKGCGREIPSCQCSSIRCLRALLDKAAAKKIITGVLDNLIAGVSHISSTQMTQLSWLRPQGMW